MIVKEHDCIWTQRKNPRKELRRLDVDMRARAGLDAAERTDLACPEYRDESQPFSRGLTILIAHAQNREVLRARAGSASWRRRPEAVGAKGRVPPRELEGGENPCPPRGPEARHRIERAGG